MALIGEISDSTLVIRSDVSQGGVLASGQVLTKGSVLGKITATDLLTLAIDTSTDGSETPYAILLEDVDATDSDTECPVLLAGIVNEEALTFGGSFDADGVRDTLRSGGIYLQKVMGA